MVGTYFLTARYGHKKLEFAKGKPSIEVGKAENLVPTLQSIAEVTKAGELDDIIVGATTFGVAKKK